MDQDGDAKGNPKEIVGLSNLDADDALLTIDFQIEEPGDESTQAKTSHLRGVVLRIKNCQLQDGPDKILVFTEFLYPRTERRLPFLAVPDGRIASIKAKFELIIAVVLEPENTGQVHVKLFQLGIFNS